MESLIGRYRNLTVLLLVIFAQLLLLAEGHLTRRLFGAMLRRMAALPVPPG